MQKHPQDVRNFWYWNTWLQPFTELLLGPDKILRQNLSDPSHSYLKSRLPGEPSFLSKQCVQVSFIMFNKIDHYIDSKLNSYSILFLLLGFHVLVTIWWVGKREIPMVIKLFYHILLVSDKRKTLWLDETFLWLTMKERSLRWHNFIMDPCELF